MCLKISLLRLLCDVGKKGRRRRRRGEGRRKGIYVERGFQLNYYVLDDDVTVSEAALQTIAGIGRKVTFVTFF